MLAINTVEQLLWHVTKQVVAKLNFEDVVIYLYDEKRQVLVQQAAFGHKNPFAEEILEPIEIMLGQGVVGQAAAQKQPLLIADTRLFADYVVDDLPRLSELAIPIIHQNKLLGVIDSEHSEKDFFTQAHTEVLTSIASLIVNQITKIQFVEKLQKTIEQLKYSHKVQSSLFEIAELSYETNSMDEFYHRLHKCINQLTFANNFYVALLSDDKKSFSISYCHDEVDQIAKNEVIYIDEDNLTITGKVLLSNKPLLVYEKNIKDMAKNKDIHLVGSIPKAWLGIPFGDDNFRGIVVVQSYLGDYLFTEKDKRLLTFSAKHIRNAIERMQHLSALKTLALQDPLTKLPNRILFNDRLNHAITHVQRKKDNALAVLFLDLDHFKKVNDSFGHHVGDQLLIEIAKRIKHSLRASDTLCRLGGDEFAILLENIDVDGHINNLTADILERIKKPMQLSGADYSISISIGGSYFRGGEITTAELLMQADKAMYQAKHNGRNQVYFFNN